MLSRVITWMLQIMIWVYELMCMTVDNK